MVVPGHDENAAVPCGSGVVGVLEHVAAAVHAGALAVPEPEHAVVPAAAEKIDLLCTPDGSGRQVFIEPWLEVNPGRFQERLGAPEFLVQAGEGGASITGNETRCIQPSPGVALALQQQQLYKGLETVQVERIGPGAVSLLQSLDLSQSHGAAIN